MSEEFRIGTASAIPGNKDRGYIKLGEYPNGEPINVPVTLINGEEPGPRVWIQACIHGNEYDGTIAIMNLAEEVNPKELKGTLILIPALNIPAFYAYSRVNPYDHIDVNRVFPGRPDGVLAYRMAHKVLEEITENADYVIDMHSGGAFFKVCYWSIYHAAGGKVEAEAEKVARAIIAPAPPMPPKVLWREDGELLKNTLFVKASERGVPAIIFEGHGGGQSQFVEEGRPDESPFVAFEGLMNVLKRLEMLSGEASELEEGSYVKISDLVIYSSEYGGIFTPKVRLGERMSKDQTIATVTSLMGEVREIKSPLDGIIMAIRTFPIVESGGWIFELARL